MAAIDLIPHEILARIFEITVIESSIVALPPLCLTSKAWNDLIACTPRLWGIIHLSRSSKIPAPRLYTQISKVKSAPLTIIIHTGFYSTIGKFHAPFVHIIHELVSLSHNWVNADVSTQVFRRLKRLDMLECLSLHGGGGDKGAKDYYAFVAETPKLRAFAASDIDEQWLQRLLSPSITFFMLSNQSFAVSKTLELLSKVPNVTTLRLTSIQQRPADIDVLSIPHLVTLELDTVQNPVQLLCHIQSPNLQTFVVTNCDTLELPMSTFFAQWSQPGFLPAKLRSLHLEECLCSGDIPYLIHWLSRLQKLVRLVLRDSALAPELLDLESSPDIFAALASPELCPSLMQLFIDTDLELSVLFPIAVARGGRGAFVSQRKQFRGDRALDARRRSTMRLLWMPDDWRWFERRLRLWRLVKGAPVIGSTRSRDHPVSKVFPTTMSLDLEALQFPELAMEIVLLILEALVECSTQAEATQYARLSRDIRPIVERLLYRCVFLKYDQIERFALMLESGCRPAAFYANHVRSICTRDVVDYVLLAKIITACPNIHSLASWNSKAEWQEYDDEIEGLEGPYPTRTLTMTGRTMMKWPPPPHTLKPAAHLLPDYVTTGLSKSDPSAPLPNFFQSLTHLQFLGVSLSWIGNQDFRMFHRLSQLTHLAVSSSAWERYDCKPALATFVSKVPDLQASIVVCIIDAVFSENHDYIMEQNSHELDPRIVLAYSPNFNVTVNENVLWRNINQDSSFLEDWGRSTTGKPDMWELAENIVATRGAHIDTVAAN
ncbi:hypothetical protein C8J56DRAFT_888718 [Mycena floridula]|nr:hypothetical protein C8J56DRAFT_888718 [Mycena floridula]